MKNHTYVETFPTQEIFRMPTFRILALKETSYVKSVKTYIFKRYTKGLGKKVKTIFAADALATNLELFILTEKTDDGKYLTKATATIVDYNGNLIAKHVEVPYNLAKQLIEKEKTEFPCLVIMKPNKLKFYCHPKK